MATTTAAQRRGASRLLVAALFVVVAGLLSMHGLGSHGVAAGDHMPAADTGRVAVGEHMPAADTGTVAIGDLRIVLPIAGGELAAAVPQLIDRGADGEPMSIAELCVAVLSAVALLLVLASSLRRRQAVPPPPFIRWRVRTVRERDRDPPSLAQLSVLRR